MSFLRTLETDMGPLPRAHVDTFLVWKIIVNYSVDADMLVLLWGALML